MNLREVEKAVARIQSRLFKKANKDSIGMLKSSFKGSGLQFKEHQVYNHGDDVRFMDWKLFARTNTPYIKTFDEERNVEIVVMVDISLSMFIGFKKISKLQVAFELCCLLFLLAKETGDKVHIILVGEKITNLQPQAGTKGIAQLIVTLDKLGLLDSKGKVNMAYRPKKHLSEKEKLNECIKHLVRRKEVVILSDFIDFLPTDGIKRIATRSNLHCFKIRSPLDKGSGSNFSIWGFRSNQNQFGKRGMFQMSTDNEEEDGLKKILGKRLRYLEVEEAYLDNFIRLMQ